MHLVDICGVVLVYIYPGQAVIYRDGYYWGAGGGAIFMIKQKNMKDIMKYTL